MASELHAPQTDEGRAAQLGPAGGIGRTSIFWKTTDELTLLADMPGVTANTIDIHFEEGVLTVEGRVQPRSPERGTNHLLCEYGVGDFHRTFRVGEQIDASTRFTPNMPAAC